MTQPNSYEKDGRLIFATLDDHETSINELYASRNEHATQIEVLKVKAGIWGLVGGAIPVGIALLIWVFQSMAGK